ncbi:hypothetical protein [Lysobacter gummosus]|uniref:hypothetical protein n=1 Tax=Lysobacter gummosus TaxID=262324 RepID=UPI0036366BBA
MASLLYAAVTRGPPRGLLTWCPALSGTRSFRCRARCPLAPRQRLSLRRRLGPMWFRRA